MKLLNQLWNRITNSLRPAPPPEGPPDLFSILNHTWIAQAIYTVVRLGIVDHLAGGPKSVAQLAQLSGAQPSPLQQVMRALESFQFFTCDEAGNYGNTATSDPLRSDRESWWRPYVLVFGNQLYAPGGAMYEAVKTGHSAWELAHGKPTYELFRTDEEQGRLFVEFMNATTNWHRDAILAAFDFSPYRHVVDVGGNRASLMSGILLAHSHLRGTVFDQPHMEEAATRRLRETGLLQRCTFVGGDFMQAVPEGGDLYTIKHVLHDWPDRDAERIVSKIASAMSLDSELMIIEGIMDDVSGQGRAIKMRDLEQLIGTGGKVRSKSEFESLLDTAGLQLDRIVPTSVLDCCLILARRRA